MLTRFKQWLKSPEFQGDEEKTTMAFILNRMGLYLFLVIVITGVIFVPIFSTKKLESWVILLFISIFFFIARRLLFAGRLELSAVIMTIPAWVLFYGIAFIGGGINSPFMPIIMTSTIVISFIVETRFKQIFLGLGILGALGLALAQNTTFEPAQFFKLSPLATWFLFSLALAFMHAYINTVVGNLKKSIQRVQQLSTSRFQAEQELQLSEDRFQKFMTYFPGLVYIKNSEGQVLFANQGFKTYLGLDPEDMIGKTNQVIFGDEFGEKVHQDDQRVLNSHSNQLIEEEFGGKSWSTYKFSIGQPDEKSLLGGITIDITEQKLVEKKLRESEFFFKESQRAAHIGSYQADFEADHWDSSEVLDEIFGIDESYHRSVEGWLEIIHLDDREMMRKYIREEVIGNRIPFNKEYRISRILDGETRWVLGLGLVGTNSDGVVTSLIGTIQDITGKKLTEEALKESENRFGNLLAGVSSVAVIGYRPDGTIEYWNKAAELLYGYTAEEVTGQNMLELIISPELHEDFQQRIQTMLLTGQPLPPVEFSFQKKNGSSVAIISSQSISYAPGRSPEIFGIDIDLTELKKAEKALVRSQMLIKAIVDSTSNLVWSVDPVNFGLLTWNPVYEKYFLQHRKITVKVGMRPEDLYPTESGYAELWRGMYGTVLEKGTLKTEYKVLSTPDIMQVSLNTLAQDGQPFGISVFGEIITERKKVEERLELSEKKYRELFNVNKDGICIFLPPNETVFGKFLEVNDAAPKIVGYSTDEMLSLTPLDLEPSVSDEQLTYRYLQLETIGSVNYETIFRHKAGHPVHVEISAQMIQYGGKPAIMNIIRDVSDRNQHESELQAIATLSSALRTAPKRAEMLPIIVEQIINLLHCDCATIEIIDPQTGEAVVEAAHGQWEELIGTRQKKGTGINALIQMTRKPYHTNDLEKDPRLFYHTWARHGIHGSVGVPLIAHDELFGFVWIGRKSDITQNEVRLLVAVTDIAANAIHRSTLHEQTQKDAEELALAYETTLEGWARALELREQETAGHSKRVVRKTIELAQLLGYPSNDLIHIQRGASLHDIGKMGIPDKILLKKGPLTEKEWVTMRKHPEYAYNLLSQIPYLMPALDIPYYHHERWDGSGYPRGLKGEEIPLAARIFAVIDVWDALLSNRPYRKAWPEDAVIQYLKDQSDKQFDPQVVAAFLKLIAEGGDISGE